MSTGINDACSTGLLLPAGYPNSTSEILPNGNLPLQVMTMLDRLYKKFDALTARHDLFKVAKPRPALHGLSAALF